MFAAKITGEARPRRGLCGVLGSVTAALLAGACAQDSGLTTASLLSGASQAGSAAPSDPAKAVEHWAKQYAASPRDLKLSLNYAASLKAAGRKGEALQVLQQASTQHGASRELASDYGRLALELGQVQLAQQLLERADDPANPDWRVVSARGTALAQQGRYKEAMAFYERAQAIAPDQPSVLNNMAMVHAANGEAGKAEVLLRKVSASRNGDAKPTQNLALVLGLQGKHDEARQAASQAATPDVAQADAEYIRKMVDTSGGGGSRSSRSAETRGPGGARQTFLPAGDAAVQPPGAQTPPSR